MTDYVWKHLPYAIYLDTNVLRSAGHSLNKPWISELLSITNKYGKYFIQDVEPGIYHIKASAEGYSTEIKYYQEVLAGETTEADFTLTGLQTYPLKTGYQFVSSRLIQENPNMLNVLENNLNDIIQK